MQGALIHLVHRHPLQCQALRVADHRLELLDDVGDDGRVRPDPEVQHTREPRAHRAVWDPGLFLSLTQRADQRRLTLMQRTTGQAPRATEMTPADPMLQQHAALGIHGQQACGPIPAPVLLPRRSDDPGVPAVSRTVGTARLTGSWWDDGHPSSFSQPRRTPTTKTK